MNKTILRYPLRTIVHPLDGFDDIKKKENKATVSSLIILVLFFLASNAHTLLSGFTINDNDPADFNVLISFATSIGLFVLFTVCNWLATSLFDGKGRLIDVINTTAFSLLPYVFGLVICTILSNVIIIEEAAFVNWILYASMLWSGFLLIAGLCAIHEYSIKKTLFSILLSVFGILIILFLAVLVFSLVMQIEYLFSSIIEEILIR